MKILVRILQIALSLWIITGSVYMMGHSASLASTWALNTLPPVFWTILGIVQIILAVGLLLSVGDGSKSKYATPSAIGLAVITLCGLFLYSAYTGLSGMLWALIPALLFAFVAYSKKPSRTLSDTPSL